MRPRFRVLFLLACAAAVFHLSDRLALLLIFGYLILEWLDDWIARRAKKKAIEKIVEDELFDWTKSEDDPDWEVKGAVERLRLNGANQVIVTRVADLIRRTTIL